MQYTITYCEATKQAAHIHLVQIYNCGQILHSVLSTRCIHIRSMVYITYKFKILPDERLHRCHFIFQLVQAQNQYVIFCIKFNICYILIAGEKRCKLKNFLSRRRGLFSIQHFCRRIHISFILEQCPMSIMEHRNYCRQLVYSLSVNFTS